MMTVVEKERDALLKSGSDRISEIGSLLTSFTESCSRSSQAGSKTSRSRWLGLTRSHKHASNDVARLLSTGISWNMKLRTHDAPLSTARQHHAVVEDAGRFLRTIANLSAQTFII